VAAVNAARPPEQNPMIAVRADSPADSSTARTSAMI
jgi:hypothetical protein